MTPRQNLILNALGVGCVLALAVMITFVLLNRSQMAKLTAMNQAIEGGQVCTQKITEIATAASDSMVTNPRMKDLFKNYGIARNTDAAAPAAPAAKKGVK